MCRALQGAATGRRFDPKKVFLVVRVTPGPAGQEEKTDSTR